MSTPTIEIQVTNNTATVEQVEETVNQALLELYGIASNAAAGLNPKGGWDASSGSFPSGTTAGDYYTVSVAGTVDGEVFVKGDWLLSLVDGASTTTYASNWVRVDYSGIYPVKYLSVASLLASTEASRGIGEEWEAAEFRYLEASPAAINQDITTAGGVKLNLLSQTQQWKLVSRPSAVTVTPSGSGVLNGTYFWGVTFVTDEGETDMSIGTTGSPSSQSATITIPVSSDHRVTSRRIYRTVAGESESQNAFFVATVGNNTATTYVDNTADGSLGDPAPHINTTGGKILNGSNVIGAVSSLATTFGVNAMPDGKGYACTAIGAQALENNAGGFRNTAVGTNSLDENTTGFNNTGVGVHALNDNQTGTSNAAFGVNAAFKVTGSSQTALGADALAEQIGGQRNVAVGASSAQLRISGDDNTFVGAESGFAAGSGSGNTGIGRRSGYDLTTGNFNSLFGYFSGQDITTGNSNTAFGGRSLFSLQSGDGNVAIGWNAGYYETASNHLWIDNTPRADLADAKLKALVYGEFAATRASQKIDFNGQVNPLAGLGMPGRSITADATVLVDDTVLTCNKSGSTLVLTLPTGKPDKILILRNQQAQLVNSASANVQPIGGGSDAVSILPATVGAWAIIRCRATGTAWEIIARGT